VLPGGRNVIPGEAEVSVEVRDLGAAVASRIVAALRGTAAEIASRRGLALELTAVSLTNGATMDGRIQDAIEAAARSLGLKTRRMPSGAGHDAMVMARHLPCGMIFVPSRDGISHSPSEWTSPEQCVSGASVLLRTITALDALV
jgi:N-carbamoyl-L-amino-acid hydrolase